MLAFHGAVLPGEWGIPSTILASFVRSGTAPRMAMQYALAPRHARVRHLRPQDWFLVLICMHIVGHRHNALEAEPPLESDHLLQESRYSSSRDIRYTPVRNLA